MSETGSRRRPINHGTGGGYRAHFRHGVPMCEPCRDVERRRHGYKAPQKQAVCGTRAGYIRRGETACAACRAANLLDHQDRRQDGLPADDPRHGTVNGYSNYGCKCGPCKQAGAADNRRRRERRSAR